MIRSAVHILVIAVALSQPSAAVWSGTPSDPLDFSGNGADVPQPSDKTGEPPPPQAPCEASIAEANGVVTLTLKDPARAGTTTSISLDKLSYAARFDGAGTLSVRAPMFHAKADLGWIGLGGRSCDRRGIAFAAFPSTVLTALIWSGPYELALHVVEPSGGRFGGPTNYISPTRPNPDHAYGLGDLQTFGLPQQTMGALGQNTSQVQLYKLPASRNPGHGDIYDFVEFVSRGNPAKPPYCGSAGQPAIPYTIIHIDSADPEQKIGKFGPVACGTSWSDNQNDNGNFQRWKFPLRERH